MIKFFRKIRQNLLSEGKTGKYLKYAIGEIILVVIGILIALQINNWNEQRKIAITEQQILNDIRIELKSNIEKLRSVNAYNKQSLENSRILAQFYTYPDKLIEFSSDSLLKLSYSLSGQIFIPKIGISNSIISSGQISYIKNNELKQSIASLQDEVTEKMLMTKDINIIGEKIITEELAPITSMYIKNGKLFNFQVKKAYSLPILSYALTGVFIGKRELALKNEEELLKIYESLLKTINQNIEE